MIDWKSSETHFLHNPRMPETWKTRLADVQHQLPTLSGHIWVLTSGSSSVDQWKWIAISKSAFLISAEAVNKRLNATVDDKWLRVLPPFHVGGLAIEARCIASGSTWVDMTEKWDAQNVHDLIHDKSITLTALVPTQLYDLVELDQPSPPSLRAIVIGGGALSATLHERAESLGYNVLPSYGMTECASQVATGLAHPPGAANEHEDGQQIPLQLLDHVEARVTDDGILELKSAALLTGFATVTMQELKYVDPKVDGWYRTQDMAVLSDRSVAILGRVGEVVKVSGELVSLPRLRLLLESVGAHERGTVMAVADERLGHRIVHIYEKSALHKDFQDWLQHYTEHSLPFEAPKEIYFIDKLPRTELGKLRWGELRQILGFEFMKIP